MASMFYGNLKFTILVDAVHCGYKDSGLVASKIKMVLRASAKFKAHDLIKINKYP